MSAATAVSPSTGRARPLRLGFLGLGRIGRDRMESLLADGACTAAVVADAAPEAIAGALSVAPEAAVAASYEDLLAADIDGIVIATPSALHARQTAAALERGLPVFCQKPLGRNTGEVRAVLEAARRADCLLGVDLSYRQTMGMRQIRELVQGGQLGKIFAADLVFHNAYGPDKAWFYDRRLSGGGALIDLGIHLVDLALWVLEGGVFEVRDASLVAEGAPLADGEAVEDYAAASGRIGDTHVRIACSWRLHAGQDARIEASFYGTRGGATFGNVGGSFYDFETTRLRGTTREVLSAPPEAWGGRAAAAWAARVAAGEGHDEAEAREHVAAATGLDAIYRCGLGGHF